MFTIETPTDLRIYWIIQKLYFWNKWFADKAVRIALVGSAVGVGVDILHILHILHIIQFLLILHILHILVILHI